MPNAVSGTRELQPLPNLYFQLRKTLECFCGPRLEEIVLFVLRAICRATPRFAFNSLCFLRST